MVKPVFPPEAKSKAIFGLVVVKVEIDKTGTPTSVKLLSGDPVLAVAVMDAVKKWRWKPYKLNGTAVEVETTISVHFEPF
jgi:protein TonB